MKNFARLVRFAWPYRGRFGLSMACAGMVALLWGANIGAVYPLLQILFDDKNCQVWIAEKVDAFQADIKADKARIEELERVRQVGAKDPSLRAHFLELRDGSIDLQAQVQAQQHQYDELGASGTKGRAGAELTLKQHELQVAKARLSELGAARTIMNDQGPGGLVARRETLDRALKEHETWAGRYGRLQPLAERYLPRDGFHTLLLLLAVTLAGVALKGWFLFLQEVLVSTIQHLTLFDLRNQFYRRTMALDLGSFSDQGTAELMARFTNDMESVSQGINILLSKVVREPLRILSCLSVALWLNWRLTCLTLVLVPVSIATTFRAGKIMKRAVRKSLESMSNIYKILQESLQGIKVVKAFTMERRERRRFFLETKSLYRKSVKVATIDALSDPVLEMLALSTVSIALLAGSYLVLAADDVSGPRPVPAATGVKTDADRRSA